jgi:hypothetical protein
MNYEDWKQYRDAPKIQKLANSIVKLPNSYHSGFGFVKSPDQQLLMVVKAIMIVLCNNPEQILDWKEIKKLISRQIVCQNIRNFNLDNVHKETYDQLVEQTKHKNFNVIKSKMVNPACGYYSEWVIEVHKYLKRKFEGYESEDEPEIIVEKVKEPPIISIPVTYHSGG